MSQKIRRSALCSNCGDLPLKKSTSKVLVYFIFIFALVLVAFFSFYSLLGISLLIFSVIYSLLIFAFVIYTAVVVGYIKKNEPVQQSS